MLFLYPMAVSSGVFVVVVAWVYYYYIGNNKLIFNNIQVLKAVNQIYLLILF